MFSCFLFFGCLHIDRTNCNLHRKCPYIRASPTMTYHRPCPSDLSPPLPPLTYRSCPASLPPTTPAPCPLPPPVPRNEWRRRRVACGTLTQAPRHVGRRQRRAANVDGRVTNGGRVVRRERLSGVGRAAGGGGGSFVSAAARSWRRRGASRKGRGEARQGRSQARSTG